MGITDADLAAIAELGRRGYDVPGKNARRVLELIQRGELRKSFGQLLDATRRELAEQYLSRLHLCLAQAAYLLGFADQRSFFRACKRWFDRSPGQVRSELLKHAT